MEVIGLLAVLAIGAGAYYWYAVSHRTPRDREIRRDPSSRPT